MKNLVITDHPICICDQALELMREVWHVSPIIHVDTNDSDWFEKASEAAKQVQKNPDYQKAMNKYIDHIANCEVCQEELCKFTAESSND